MSAILSLFDLGMAALTESKAPHTGSGQIRLIGGRWRGRKLAVAQLDGLRPTPDRVRETLFNWLQPYLWQARCLDLFAGTGALGLEALSRQAGHCTFVEQARPLQQALNRSLTQLDAQTQSRVIASNALLWLSQNRAEAFDLIFVDPPFRSGLLAAACQQLDAGWVKPGSLLYLEAESELTEWPVPAHWRCLKDKRAGQVAYSLWQVEDLSTLTPPTNE